jgi:rhodanese-related sulfurtransferase
MHSKTIPEITVEEFAKKMQSQDQFILLDVRETWELDFARIIDNRVENLAMSLLAIEGVKALPELAKSHELEIYVLCHHGIRSADVTGWLVSQGWKNVLSVSGGIDEYARMVDSSVGFY